MNNLKENRQLLLKDIVVVRKIPMTEKGCDMLRAIRQYQIDELQKDDNSMQNVSIPFPTSLQLLMADYCKLRGINVPEYEGNHNAN